MDVIEHERISNYTLRLKQIKRKEQLFYRCSTIQSQNTLYIQTIFKYSQKSVPDFNH